MYQKIFVPVDGSPASNLGLNEAIKLAKDQGAKLLVDRGRSPHGRRQQGA